MERVIVYGMSTEGYTLASRMSGRAEVYIVDEYTNTGILLRPEIVNMYSDVGLLLEDESLLRVAHLKDVAPGAGCLFFAPRIRQSGLDANVQIHARLREAAAHLKPDSSFVCNLPVGLGGNAQYISLLKHVTGADREQLSYYYYPLEGASQPDVIGAYGGGADASITGTLSDGEKRLVGVCAAERIHALRVLSKFASLFCVIETCKHATDAASRRGLEHYPPNNTFLDGMAGGLYDLRQINDSHDNVRMLQFLTNNSIKSVEGFVKRVTDKVRATLRSRGMMVSRTSIAVAWSMDRHSMRGDKIETRKNLLDRIQDYAGRVDEYDGQTLHTGRTTVVVACSQGDYERLERHARDDLIIVKATPLV